MACCFRIITLIAFVSCSLASGAPEHPRLLLVRSEQKTSELFEEKPLLFATAIERVKERIDPLLKEPPDVPKPIDPGGGYTHERHKANGMLIWEAGALYQWTGDFKYADFARELLLKYANLYPTLELHPKRKNQAPGRLFWQSLNESVWLTYAIQGVDAIFTTLEENDRSKIEHDLLRPIAHFLSVELAHIFNRIHNHGTWATAAVGMTGYVLDDEDLVHTALFGTTGDGEGGFLAQMRLLFSPEGYYLEGPYYQRYALMPFVVFGRAIANNEPKRRIFEYRNQILVKAIHTAIELSYAGKFFPVNDAIREKGLDTMELDYAITIAYAMTKDSSYLSLIDSPGNIVLTTDGFNYALAKSRNEEIPFPFRSKHFRDGAEGSQGALSILRTGEGPSHSALVFKATSHGMGHGHFDRLHWMFYDDERPIVVDYGAARYLNVPQKDGGRYLPENLSWAKQTVAHNTLVVGERSQFKAEWKTADHTWPVDHFFQVDKEIQVVSARDVASYPGTEIRRTMMLVEWPDLDSPIVVDVLEAKSAKTRRFDLPLYFDGDFIESSPKITVAKSLDPLGESYGYQHLWNVGDARIQMGEAASLTWLNDNRFYTYKVLANRDMEVVATRIGANDPNFNLRAEPGMLFRADEGTELVMVAVLEPHGEYDSAREFTVRSESQIAQIDQFQSNGDMLITIETKHHASLRIALSFDTRADQTHELQTPEETYQWHGFHQLF